MIETCQRWMEMFETIWKSRVASFKAGQPLVQNYKIGTKCLRQIFSREWNEVEGKEEVGRLLEVTPHRFSDLYFKGRPTCTHSNTTRGLAEVIRLRNPPYCHLRDPTVDSIFYISTSTFGAFYHRIQPRHLRHLRQETPCNSNNFRRDALLNCHSQNMYSSHFY